MVNSTSFYKALVHNKRKQLKVQRSKSLKRASFPENQEVCRCHGYKLLHCGLLANIEKNLG